MTTKDKDLSLAEAAVLTGKCVETIYRLVRSQRIPARKDDDGNWRLSREALLAYYASRAAAARFPKRQSAVVAVVLFLLLVPLAPGGNSQLARGSVMAQEFSAGVCTTTPQGST